MHAIHTYILRIFFDSDLPTVLRGSLQAVDGGEPFVFVDTEGLLALLQNQAGESDEAAASKRDRQGLDLD